MGEGGQPVIRYDAQILVKFDTNASTGSLDLVRPTRYPSVVPGLNESKVGFEINPNNAL